MCDKRDSRNLSGISFLFVEIRRVVIYISKKVSFKSFTVCVFPSEKREKGEKSNDKLPPFRR